MECVQVECVHFIDEAQYTHDAPRALRGLRFGLLLLGGDVATLSTAEATVAARLDGDVRTARPHLCALLFHTRTFQICMRK